MAALSRASCLLGFVWAAAANPGPLEKAIQSCSSSLFASVAVHFRCRSVRTDSTSPCVGDCLLSSSNNDQSLPISYKVSLRKNSSCQSMSPPKLPSAQTQFQSRQILLVLVFQPFFKNYFSLELRGGARFGEGQRAVYSQGNLVFIPLSLPPSSSPVQGRERKGEKGPLTVLVERR